MTAQNRPEAHRVINDHVDDFVARHEAVLAQARLGLERWVDQQVADRIGPITADRTTSPAPID